jgi:hypothetical protein
VIGPEPLQRALTRAPDVLRAPVDAAVARLLGIDHEPELGRDLELVAAAGDGAPYKLLVRVRAVDLGGVEEGDAELERAIDRLESRRLIATAVGVRHPHATQSLRRYLQAVASQLSSIH